MYRAFALQSMSLIARTAFNNDSVDIFSPKKIQLRQYKTSGIDVNQLLKIITGNLKSRFWCLFSKFDTIFQGCQIFNKRLKGEVKTLRFCQAILL